MSTPLFAHEIAQQIAAKVGIRKARVPPVLPERLFEVRAHDLKIQEVLCFIWFPW